MDGQFPAIGGHKVLEQIGDEKGAAALADGMFRLGRGKAAKSVQEAMRSIYPSSIKVADGKFGTKSLTAFKHMLADPNSRNRLINAIADQFTAEAPGEKSRWDALRP